MKPGIPCLFGITPTATDIASPQPDKIGGPAGIVTLSLYCEETLNKREQLSVFQIRLSHKKFLQR
jgi:hypothetical protein